MTASVQLLSDTIDAGQEAFVIQTPLATFIYHKEGGGFSHLIDVDGNDWIGYAPGVGPAGEYRGIPNMVFRGAELANALELKAMITNSRVPVPNGLLKTYPNLTGIALNE